MPHESILLISCYSSFPLYCSGKQIKSQHVVVSSSPGRTAGRHCCLPWVWGGLGAVPGAGRKGWGLTERLDSHFQSCSILLWLGMTAEGLCGAKAVGEPSPQPTNTPLEGSSKCQLPLCPKENLCQGNDGRTSAVIKTFNNITKNAMSRCCY